MRLSSNILDFDCWDICIKTSRIASLRFKDFQFLASLDIFGYELFAYKLTGLPDYRNVVPDCQHTG